MRNHIGNRIGNHIATSAGLGASLSVALVAALGTAPALAQGGEVVVDLTTLSEKEQKTFALVIRSVGQHEQLREGLARVTSELAVTQTELAGLREQLAAGLPEVLEAGLPKEISNVDLLNDAGEVIRRGDPTQIRISGGAGEVTLPVAKLSDHDRVVMQAVYRLVLDETALEFAAADLARQVENAQEALDAVQEKLLPALPLLLPDAGLPKELETLRLVWKNNEAVKLVVQ